MNPPRATRNTFPDSWRRWRMVRAGEKLRFMDRVLSSWVIGPRWVIRSVHSVQLGREHVGRTVRPHNRSAPNGDCPSARFRSSRLTALSAQPCKARHSKPERKMTPAQRKRVLDAIPSNWCDSLLTGPQNVLGDAPVSCPQIERLLRAVRTRVEQALPKPKKPARRKA